MESDLRGFAAGSLLVDQKKRLPSRSTAEQDSIVQENLLLLLIRVPH